MRRGWWALLLVVSGCFTPDLGEGQVACGADGACPPDYVCRSDGRCYHGGAGTADLDGVGALGGGGADLAMSCGSDGARLCLDGAHSAVCTSGVAVADRPCPPTSACAAGRCTPPGPGAGGGVTASCAAPGWDATCKTGLCAGDAKSGTRACLNPCKGDGDCGGSGAKCQGTLGQPATIEGAAATGVKFCISGG